MAAHDVPRSMGLLASRRLRVRVAAASAVALLCGLALATDPSPSAFASFTAETENASSQSAGGWVAAATIPAATVAGYGAALTWHAGTSGVAAEQVYAADGGTGASASCPAVNTNGTWPQAGYTLVATMSGPTIAAYTDTGASANNGHWRCYLLVGSHNTWWTPTAFPNLRVGLYPVSVVITSNRHAGQPSNNDTIAITFNQNVNAAAGTHMCMFAGTGTGALLLGDNTCANAGSDGYSVGKLTGLTVSGTGHTSITTTTTHPAANEILFTITQNSGINVSGTETYTAATSITSSTGGAAACNAAFCTVAATGSF